MEPARHCSNRFLLTATLSIGIFFTALSTAAVEPTAAETEPPIKLLEVQSNLFLGVVNWKSLDYQVFKDFETVIDLRYPYEGVYDEMGKLRTLGVRHINLPTSSHEPEEKFVSALENTLTTTRGTKTLIHDSNGYRTAMLWAAHLVNTGSTAAEAVAAVQPIYQGSEFQHSIEKYALAVSRARNNSTAPSTEVR